MQLDLQLVAALVQSPQQIESRDAGKMVSANRDLLVPVRDINVVPGLKAIRNLMERLFVGLFQIRQRLPRKDYAPPKCVVGPVALVDGDVVRGVSLLHENGKIQPRWSAADDVNFHLKILAASYPACWRLSKASPNLSRPLLNVSGWQ